MEQLIDRHLGPLNLKQTFLDQVEVLRREGHEERYIEWAIEKVIHGAEGNARRYGKPEGDYLRRAVENEHLLRW